MELLLILNGFPKFVTCASLKYPPRLTFKHGLLKFSTFVLDLGLAFLEHPSPHFASRLLSSLKDQFLFMRFILLTARELYFLRRQVAALATRMGPNLWFYLWWLPMFYLNLSVCHLLMRYLQSKLPNHITCLPNTCQHVLV